MMKNKLQLKSIHRLLHGNAALSFVPKHQPSTEKDVLNLQSFVNNNDELLVLTGAGISTESGLPDYRSAEVGLYERTNHKPVQHQEFISSEARRKAYWARNYVAWNTFVQTKPNIAHQVLSDWQLNGKVGVIVTQNVDRLHQKAGSKHVIELHGSGFDVKCLACSFNVARETFQNDLDIANAHLPDLQTDSILRPDGDVYLPPEIVDKFQIPPCPQCSGILKPNIVFFGDNVPKRRVDQVYELVTASDGLVVIGSSLHVYSGYRFVLHALEKNKQIAIVNIGPTRADHLKEILFVRKRAGEILPQVVIK